MGRLTGLPHFFTSDAYEEEKEDIRTLRRARKEMQDEAYMSDDNEEDLVKFHQIEIAQRMQRQSQGHTLRRTTASLNFNGEELVALPPCETTYAYLNLTERELQIITANGEALEETYVARSSRIRISGSDFFVALGSGLRTCRTSSSLEGFISNIGFP